MAKNPIENNPVSRFILGFAVIFGMFVGGGIGARVFASISMPFAELIGVVIGALAAFAMFSWFYFKYDKSAS